MSLSIVLTCYNEVPLIFESYRALSSLMGTTNIEHEFIVVDDGSRMEVRKALADFFSDSPAKLILSEQNEGRGAAVTKGVRAATKDYVCFIDTDLEIPAHAVPVLYYTGSLLSAEMVLAERVYRWTLRPSHIFRNLGSIGLRVASSLMLGLGRLDTETGAKVFHRRAVLELLDNVVDTGWVWDTEIVAEALKRSQRVMQVPIVVTRRNDKGSSVHPFSDAWRYLKAVIAYQQRGRGQRPIVTGGSKLEIR
jgi:dolichyl-phosphate beta-glucosyltransferase